MNIKIIFYILSTLLVTLLEMELTGYTNSMHVKRE